MYKTRYEEVKATISKVEAVRWIKEYGGEYDSNSELDVWDQLLACESVSESTTTKQLNLDDKERNGDVGVIGVDYGGCKCNAVTELFQNKKEVIEALRTCRSRTPYVQVSSLLDDLFEGYPTNKKGYWFDVARFYTPRAINRTLIELQKLASPSHETVRNPAAYFTFLIKMRKRRRRYARKRPR